MFKRMAEWSKAIGCKLIDYYLRRFKSYFSYINGYDEIGRHAKFRTWFTLLVVQVRLPVVLRDRAVRFSSSGS